MKQSGPVQKMLKQLKINGNLKMPLLLAVLGAAVLLIFPKEEAAPALALEAEPAVQETVSVDRQIADILSSVEGAGEVRVMLTVRSNGETEYQTDRDESNREGESTVRTTTVFGGTTADSALVVRQTAPEYLGAVIVAEGADSSEVCYQLTKAVSGLTGLPTHKITVLKMK